MPDTLESLLASARLWRGANAARAAASELGGAVPSGYEALDACLPGGGWPERGLIEFLLDEHGIGELQIVMPLLRRANPGSTFGDGSTMDRLACAAFFAVRAGVAESRARA